jgi:tRNA threonylcarbamoyladenosine biosynthesis protein TsaB
MALILSLETSAARCAVALHKTGRLIGIREIHEPQAHAAKVSVLIQELITTTPDVSIKDLAAVAVSSGPGSYTGLRIGTSTAKGICYALNLPLISVRTLDLLAAQVSDDELTGALLCPMIDAKRMEVYCQIMDHHLKIISPVEARIVEHDSFSDLLQRHRMFFFGDGAAKCKPVIPSANAFFIDGVYPSAAVLGEMAYEKYRKSDFEDLGRFTPFYLKDFVAKKARAAF